MSRQHRHPVHGILLLDKPKGLSSNQALQAVKRLYGAAKAGHTGSLDPMATGLLPLCFGEATKIAGLLLGARKAYEAECRLGVTTRTDDAEGEVVERRAVPSWDDAAISQALAGFVGRIEQVPPAYSALKRDGIPMYVRARRGEKVELAARIVEVHAVELLARGDDWLRFRVECGSGTYVRSLARDLGETLGCGAHLVALRRLWVDPFRHPVMHTLDTLRDFADREPGRLESLLLPLDAGLASLPAVQLDAGQTLALTHGRPVNLATSVQGTCRAYAADGRLLALAEGDAEGTVRVVRGFNLPARRNPG